MSLFEILLFVLDVAKWIILAQFIMSWLINFQVLNLRQPLVYQIWSALNRVLQPVYDQIRRILPPIQGLDLAPLVVLIAIYALRAWLISNVALFL